MYDAVSLLFGAYQYGDVAQCDAAVLQVAQYLCRAIHGFVSGSAFVFVFLGVFKEIDFDISAFCCFFFTYFLCSVPVGQFYFEAQAVVVL